jgi:hypothetical protein
MRSGRRLNACEPTIHLHAQVAGRCRGGMPEVLCDMAMAALLGIHLWRIGWSPFHGHTRVRGHLVLDDDRAMRAQPVPDHDHRPRDAPLTVLQGEKHTRGPHGMFNMTRLNRAGQRQGHDRGQLPTSAHTPEARRVPPRSPSRAGLGATGEAGCIDEDDLRAAAAGLWLIRGQSCVSQAWTRASSRTRASTAGCCGLQPSVVSRSESSWAW